MDGFAKVNCNEFRPLCLATLNGKMRIYRSFSRPVVGCGMIAAYVLEVTGATE